MLGGEEPGWLAEAGPGVRGAGLGAGRGRVRQPEDVSRVPEGGCIYYTHVRQSGSNFEGRFCMEGVIPELLLHKA